MLNGAPHLVPLSALHGLMPTLENHMYTSFLLPIEFKLLLRVAKLARSSLSLSEITKEVSVYIEVYKGCPST